ncbi:MAG TPA: hypothetical protein VN715_18455 [Roseiarcus sp.]|nr:hypothetical protein [Roseiarcus sp.]
MRLPTDATLLIGPGAEPALEQAWREERLPMLALDGDLSGIEATLEAIGTATVVACGEYAASAAAAAAALGFRTFLVGEAAAEGVVTVSPRQALDAARLARAIERWKAARAASV